MNIDPVILGIIIVAVVIFGGITAAIFISNGTPVENYQATDVARPGLEISETSFDFGKMKLSEIKTKDLEIKNNGSKPLIISNILTSCDCTFAQFIVNGQASQKFSMQRDQKWRGEIQPNSAATLKIIYEPRLMPVKGNVSRSIFFKSNDPQNPSVSIKFTAYVE
ncbi:MAG: DUF1573 domain-containing protein [Patescibacteria group bacterium]